MSNEVSTQSTSTELSIAPDQSGFNDVQVAALAQIGVKTNKPADVAVLFHQAKATGLDPFKREIYMIERKGKNTIQTGIDGFYKIADRATRANKGTWGIPETLWCGPDGVWTDVWLQQGPPAAAKVTVERDGSTFTTVALTSEYQAEGPMWKKMPARMIAKCFDADTEVLTTNGFELFSEVTGQVMQVTQNGVESTDAKPFWQAYSGPMIQLDSDDLNFNVTPNHDMVTTTGKIEAGDMFHAARSRPKFHIPRAVQGSRAGIAMTDDLIRLAAAYVCDGYDKSGGKFAIGVARPRKVEAIQALNIHESTKTRDTRPVTASSGRVITPTLERNEFVFDAAMISDLASPGKVINIGTLMSMSREQAQLFVDTLMFFDGHEQKDTGVRRFYTSRLDHLEAFELAAVAGGYSVSPRRERHSDLSDRPNYHITISGRDEIPVIRWGREYSGHGGNTEGRTGLEKVESDGRGVWCVTVPSGEIIVRRRGFSMRVGNCAEALGIRRAFPDDLSGLYTTEEMQQADNPAQQQARSNPAPTQGNSRISQARARTQQQTTTEPMCSQDQWAAIQKALVDTGNESGEQQQQAVASIVGRTVNHPSEMTAAEADSLLAVLTEGDVTEGEIVDDEQAAS